MHSSNDEYLEATKEAIINQYSEGNKLSTDRRGMMISLMLLSTIVVGYLGYSYMAEKADTIDNELIVSMESQNQYSNVKNIEDETTINTEVNKGETVSVSSQKEASIPKNYFMITVKKGDTLASLSKKYFGNEMSFNRILSFNKGLKETSILNIGQTIYIPR